MTSAARPTPSRLRRGAVAAAVAGSLLVLAACGTPAPKQADLTAALVDSGIPKKVAECTSKALVDNLSTSELQELAERGGGGAPVDDPADDKDSATKLATAMAACKELMVSTQPTTTTTPVQDSPGDTLPTTPMSTDGAVLEPASTTTTAAP